MKEQMRKNLNRKITTTMKNQLEILELKNTGE